MDRHADTLTVDHLSVRFGAIRVFEHLTFKVARGTALAIIGPNGSGKTVLFRALIGGPQAVTLSETVFALFSALAGNDILAPPLFSVLAISRGHDSALGPIEACAMCGT